jgi:hypothetical protein
MPRFFLHFFDGTTLYPDKEGEEFANLEQACDAAIRSARELMADAAFGANAAAHRFDITDASGEVHAIINFAEARLQ